MRVWSLIAAVVIAGLTTTTTLAQGQAQAGGAGSMTIGVVDMGHILQNHPTLKGKMEQIKGQMEAADKAMATKRDAIVKQMEQLREQFTEGTPEYDRAEKAIAEQDTEFRLELVKKRKEFETAQANVLYQVYTEINSLLKYVGDQMGTQLVLRVSREPMDPKKPETIDMAMSQGVLYFNNKIDLTDWVLKALEQNAQTASRPAAATTR